MSGIEFWMKNELAKCQIKNNREKSAHTLPKTTDTKVKIKSIMLDKLKKKVSVG